MDTFGGSYVDPGSLHKYQYVGGRPQDTVDPTGLFLSTMSVTLAVLVTLAIASVLPIAACRSAAASIEIPVVRVENPSCPPAGCPLLDAAAIEEQIRNAISLWDSVGVSVFRGVDLPTQRLASINAGPEDIVALAGLSSWSSRVVPVVFLMGHCMTVDRNPELDYGGIFSYPQASSLRHPGVVAIDGSASPMVLAHELGHALGLEHSKNEQRLMHPSARASQLTPEAVAHAKSFLRARNNIGRSPGAYRED